MRDECEHGSLRQSCAVCDLHDDVRDLERERDELAAQNTRLREAAARVCLEFPDKITRAQKELALLLLPAYRQSATQSGASND